MHLVNILVGAVLSCVLPLLMCLFCSFRSSFQNSACSFQKQRNCRYSNFPYFSGFLRCNRQKSLKYQAFRQILSRPKPPSKIAKQPLIHKTRNAVSRKASRVRIPNSPPKTQSYQGFCPYDWAFLFSQGHIGVHDFRQELRCASRSALYPAESGYCPLHLPR